MPRKFRHKNNWKSDTNQADDSTMIRHPKRVAFKNKKVEFVYHNNRPKKNNSWAAKIRSHLEDDDIDMDEFQMRNEISSRRRDSPIPNKKSRRKLMPANENWVSFYRIIIPHGSKLQEHELIELLQQVTRPDPIIPINYKNVDNDVHFYLESYKVASKLYANDKKLTYPDGYRVTIIANTGLPQVVMNEELVNKMHLVIHTRYNPDTKSMDLTQFHRTPELVKTFCGLFKPVVMLKVIDIIVKDFPFLVGLSFNDNYISGCEPMKNITKQLPNLQILDLRNNKLKHINSFECLKGMNLTQLFLEGNPLCSKYKDNSNYISDVRAKFQKLVKLDNIDLPPLIGFDVNESSTLPAPQQSFMLSAEGQEFARKFLEEYYRIFDSDDRNPLINAYADHALFSMTISYPYGQSPKNSVPLNWYQTDNRNLLKINDKDRIHRLLKFGKVSVTSYLIEMPKTVHDLQSFKVDLHLFEPTILMMTINGVFKELGSGYKSPPTRAFSKSLVIVPFNAGFCIINETLHITNATDKQMKEAFKVGPAVQFQQQQQRLPTIPEIQPGPSGSQHLAVPPTPVQSPVHSSQVNNDVYKQEMAKALCQQSGMNLDYSIKCLEDTNWDFDLAISTFQNLHKQGSIPAEAFVHY